MKDQLKGFVSLLNVTITLPETSFFKHTARLVVFQDCTYKPLTIHAAVYGARLVELDIPI